MSIRTLSCVLATCDDCGRSTLSDTEDYDFTPHFDTLDEATAALSEHGWTTPADGRHRCRGCSEKATCAAEGHVHSQWIGCLCDGSHPGHPAGCGRSAPSALDWRYCLRCHVTTGRREAPS